MFQDAIHPPRGRGRLYRTGRAVGKSPAVVTRTGAPRGWTPVTPWVPNLVMYDWATLVGNLLVGTGLNYSLSTVYVEFQNVAAPDDPVAAPGFGRPDGVDYYNGLATSPDTDYLRVPLIAKAISSSDPAKFPGGNVVTVFAQTAGLVGVHGKTFSAAAGSKVFGAAVVAAVDAADPTRDLVFSRFYFDPDQQQAKLDTSQIGVSWQVPLR